MRIVWIVVLAGLLGGCYSAGAIREQEVAKLPADKPAAYREGYNDGCQTSVHEGRSVWGYETEGPKRDDARMTVDAQYQVGWLDGQRGCARLFRSSGDLFVIKK